MPLKVNNTRTYLFKSKPYQTLRFNSTEIPPEAISLKRINFHFCVNLAETYVRHPNSYLPKYNIQSETDGESVPLTHSNDLIANKRMLKNGVDIGPHQIIQSDEEEDDDVQAYGFPSQKRRNRVQQSDLELELSKSGES